jgi:hypothetical protein
MSCPNRCSNDFKVKNFPDEIECVVANKIKSGKGLPVTNLPEGLSVESEINGHLEVGPTASGEILGAKNVISPAMPKLSS